MASPAARPNFRRYNAGSCLLEVEVQPSALSQWSAKPIAKELSFQLWLQDADGESAGTTAQSAPEQERVDTAAGRKLIAQGDRTDLKSLSQYFQQQTEQVLAIAALNPRTRQTAASSPPTSLQITESLGYLQLCDITSVLSQHAQETRTLPIALDSALTVEPTAAVAREGPSESSNVLPLDEARRQRAGDTDHRQSSRRRRRTQVWASSAAAALFAVGLTTTLLSRDPSLQESNVASDTVPEAVEEDAGFEGGNSQSAESAVEHEAPEDSNDEKDSNNAIGESDDIARGSSQPTEPIDVRPNAVVESSSGSSRSPQPTAATSPNQTAPRAPVDNASVDNAPAADSDIDTAGLAESPPLGVSREPTNTEIESAGASASPPPATPPSPAPAASESELNSNVLSRQPPPMPSQTPEASIPAVEAAGPGEPNQGENEAADRTVAQVPRRVERAAPELFSLPPSNQSPQSTAGGASRGRIATTPTDAAAEERSDASLSGAISTAGVIATINLVQTYFQQRWQRRESGALSYQLQLNATGEVVSFVGLDALSQEAHDRILPADVHPTFESSPPLEDDLVLRIQLRQDGTVEVTHF